MLSNTRACQCVSFMKRMSHAACPGQKSLECDSLKQLLMPTSCAVVISCDEKIALTVRSSFIAIYAYETFKVSYCSYTTVEYGAINHVARDRIPVFGPPPVTLFDRENDRPGLSGQLLAHASRVPGVFFV